MNDEKGQLSGEYLLLIGSLITVLMISAFLIGNENELNIAMAAAKSGVSEGVASSSSAIYPKETFNEYDNMDGLKHPYSVSVLNISYNSSGIDKNYGKQKIQFKVYAKASQDYNKKEL
ncbi:class III signal peptide-containing protein, partial [Methanobrevibacter smithii]|uniref:class III signal peptide-containing protein n=3 Tax=Methanobacteriaceae TaxID=2159 RepID=UPI0003606044